MIEMDSSRSFFWEDVGIVSQASFNTLQKGCRKLAQLSLGQRQRATGKDCEGGGVVGRIKSMFWKHGSTCFFLFDS